MKFTLSLVLGVLSSFTIYAGTDSQPIVGEGVCSNITIVARTADNIDGYIDAIAFDIPTYSGYTCTVVVATSNQTVGTFIVTEDKTYYPKIQACDTGGVAISGEYVRPVLYGEKLQATFTTDVTSLVTRTVSVLVKTNDK